MSALLYCRTGPMAGSSFSLDAEATVGRTGENAVKLSNDLISSRHARIWPDAESGAWMLQDLESSNGTLVDGSPATEPVALGDLSVVTFAGHFDFIFQVVSSASVSAPQAAAPAREAPAETQAAGDDVATQPGGAAPSLPETGDESGNDVRTKVGGGAPALPNVGEAGDEDVRTRVGGGAPSLPDVSAGGDANGDDDIRTKIGGGAPDLPDTGADDGIRTRAGGAPPALPDVTGGTGATEATGAAPGAVTLHVRSSDTEVSTFELRSGRNVIGRSGDADIRVDDASLSRSHAVITVDRGRVTVSDDGSKNGTWIDGEKVSGARQVTPENRLRFGFRIEAWISQD